MKTLLILGAAAQVAVVPVFAQKPTPISWTGTCVATGCPSRGATCPDAPAEGCKVQVGNSLLPAVFDGEGRFTTPIVDMLPGYAMRILVTAPGCLPRELMVFSGKEPGMLDLGAIKLDRGYANRTTIDWGGMTQTLMSQWPEYLPGDTVRAALIIGNPNPEQLSLTFSGEEDCRYAYWAGNGAGDTLFTPTPGPKPMGACIQGFGGPVLGPGDLYIQALPPFRIPPTETHGGWALHMRFGITYATVGGNRTDIGPRPGLELPVGWAGHSAVRRVPRVHPAKPVWWRGFRLDGRRF